MILVLGIIFGICLGSLTKVIADRSLTDKTFWGRSYCEKCKKTLAWYDLFPILSYIFLKGRCRYCKVKLSLEYPLTEAFMGLLTALIFVKFIPLNFLEIGLLSQILTLSAVFYYCFILVILTAVLITDFKTGYIPDRITYPGIWIAFIYLTVLASLKIYLLYNDLSISEIGKYLLPPYSDYFLRHSLEILQPLLAGSLMAALIGFFFYLLIILTKGKGMGGGDLKLGVFLGLVLGFPYSVVAMMLSFFLGSVFGIILILIGKKKFGQTIPFGPFMSLGGIITILWGTEILSWYLRLKLV